MINLTTPNLKMKIKSNNFVRNSKKISFSISNKNYHILVKKPIGHKLGLVNSF